MLAFLAVIGCSHSASYRAPSAPVIPPFIVWKPPACLPGSWLPDLPPAEVHADASIPNTIEGQIVRLDSRFGTATVSMEAAISLEDLHRQMMTDGAGRFHFGDVPTGKHVLLSREIGYSRRADTVTVSAQFGWRVRLPMSEHCIWPM